MENAKKMILIDPEVIEKLKRGNNNSSIGSNITHLDEEMQKVLNTKLGDREKWTLYMQTLQRYLYFIGKDRKPLVIPIFSQDEMESERKEDVKPNQDADVAETPVKKDEEIPKVHDYYVKSQMLQLIPKSYKQKGELLLDFLLKNKEKVHWNSHGTVFIDNKEVYKSNIVDLFNDIIRPLKNSSPHGWMEFCKALKELGIPLSYIGNPKRSTFISVMSKTPDFGKRFETETQSTPYNLPTPTSHTSETQSKDKAKRKIDWQKWTPY
jgi:hypothetical protein